MSGFDAITSEGQAEFLGRHVGPNEEEQKVMLDIIGAGSLDELMLKIVPEAIQDKGDLDLSPPMTEAQLLAHLKQLGQQNKEMISLIGQGYYGCYLPSVIKRNVLENPGWYTSYTPYQPEISQGRLEALINFQTLVIDLTGLPVTNASLLDEATAAAEAVSMMRRQSKSKSVKLFVSDNCFAQTLDVIKTRTEPLDIEVIVGGEDSDFSKLDVFGAILQYSGANGEIVDWRDAVQQLQANGALVAIAADPLMLTLAMSPGQLGADIAFGSMQRFGIPMFLGGPHAAFLAADEKHKRAMPGRIVGVSHDRDGRVSYRLALQTREQHIRREKATSNICTAQALLAILSGFYAVYHGAEGLRNIAARVHGIAAHICAGLKSAGIAVENATFFDTLTISVPGKAAHYHDKARDAGINLREIDADHLGLSVDETTDLSTLEIIWSLFELDPKELAPSKGLQKSLPEALIRTDEILQHPVFNKYRSETELMRYARRLMDKDIALDRSMIPLGSCTMKLNAATEMIPVSYSEFANIHPFAPENQTLGYRKLISELERMLCVVTGYDAVSLQPNSGAQGEYAGLLAIRNYHLSRGDKDRIVCLIPSSAHGTNPASAQMVGMDVVVVKCDDNGDIDIDDLSAKAETHREKLAAIMVTYPSTHGVFEERIREVCDIVHENGGQVYMDGANLNAQIGLTSPGFIGSDVSHLNLHKTFCIPHGGGGPGVGPIGVKSHLAPYLPGHKFSTDKDRQGPPVSAAEFGSAGILPISYAYIKLMGAAGLARATEVAILNANYIAHRLKNHFPILYKGRNGYVAHECILDLRQITHDTDVTVEDVAKRLMDYGFHAPTMSWPVAGSLMVEPTESENLEELDRFCEAMISIRNEIKAIESGKYGKENNPLKYAPHTAEDITSEAWDRPYSREEAVFPSRFSRSFKYWPPVSRIDNVAGDRNLVCVCPPLEAYAEAAE